MKFTQILITRPRTEAEELKKLLAPVGIESIVLPAFEFHPAKLASDQIRSLEQAANESLPPLLVFTSPRAVTFGLGQLPRQVTGKALLAAIGTSTGEVLRQAGAKVQVRPQQGFTSEDLLATIGSDPALRGECSRNAYIFAAPGGREALRQGLEELGFETHMLMVYERRPAELDPAAVAAIEQAEHLLSVWTSANTMNSLHQRLPSRCWLRICRGEWLVVSDRLLRLARAFSPAGVHLAGGPSNSDIISAIKSLG